MRLKLFAIQLLLGLLLVSTALQAQQRSSNPFVASINTTSDVIVVDFVDFAIIPDAGGDAPRLMHMITEPGTQRHFVSTMPGMLYSVSMDGETVVPYIDINDFGVEVMSAGRERGVQSFDFHPQFAIPGTPGYGKFYTYSDVNRSNGAANFQSGGRGRTHDTVLLEWTAIDAAAVRYDGAAPRELFRAAQPYANHNGGELAFNPLSQPGDDDFGLLYIGLADGGSGGDPLGVGQDLRNPFGKILRIDPMGNNSGNGQYGIPVNNPFISQSNALGEIFAYGVRNPQRFGWDSRNGRMLVADIGQNQVEEISPVSAGANLGWNSWEGSFRYVNRQVSLQSPRSEAGLTWPIVEYDHDDPILVGRAAISGVHVYRGTTISQLQNTMIFADIPSGELLYVSADLNGDGGQDAIRRILLNDAGEAKNLLQLIRETNRAQGKRRAARADLRFGVGANQELFLLNKADGIIRKLVPSN